MGSYITKTRTLKTSQNEMSSIILEDGSVYDSTESPHRLVGDQSTYTYTSTGVPSTADIFKQFLQTTERPSLALRRGELQGDQFDDGHEFSSLKHTSEVSHPDWEMTGLYGVRFKGLLMPIGSGFFAEYPDIPPMSQNDINFYGGKAIANTIPTRPGADLSTFLGEGLKDGLPVRESELPFIGRDWDRNVQIDSVWLQNQAKRFLDNPSTVVRDVAGGFLTAQFTFLPFVSEITRIIKQLVNMTDILKQYVRDGQPGRQVRRRYSFPTLREVSTPREIAQGQCVLTGQTFNSRQVFAQHSGDKLSGPIIQQDRTFQKVWFKGSYSYLYPMSITSSGTSPVEDVLNRVADFERKAQLLLGTRLTPEALWNLAPWSWLLDWKLAVGDALRNYTQFSQDNLVLRYGYLMRETRVERTYRLEGLQFNGVRPGPVWFSRISHRKERFKATPYGFGLDPRSFTDAQWAILISLGLTLGDENTLRNS